MLAITSIDNHKSIRLVKKLGFSFKGLKWLSENNKTIPDIIVHLRPTYPERSKLLLAALGKFKMGKACIYVKKLSDINISALKELCIESIKYINEHHECSCRIKQTN